MNKIQVKCETCGKIFDKLKKEINRCKKNGMKNYCSRSCVATYRNNLMTDEYWKEQYEKQKKTFNIASVAGLSGRKDQYSPFRSFINSCKNRNKYCGWDIDIDIFYLKELWESQNGMCSYTKIKMILPKKITDFTKIHSLKRASLDRIDSLKGYIKGNVEFVCYAINLAKNNYSKVEMTSFINDLISLNQNTFSVTQAQPT